MNNAHGATTMGVSSSRYQERGNGSNNNSDDSPPDGFHDSNSTVAAGKSLNNSASETQRLIKSPSHDSRQPQEEQEQQQPSPARRQTQSPKRFSHTHGPKDVPPASHEDDSEEGEDQHPFAVGFARGENSGDFASDDQRDHQNHQQHPKIRHSIDGSRRRASLGGASGSWRKSTDDMSDHHSSSQVPSRRGSFKKHTHFALGETRESPYTPEASTTPEFGSMANYPGVVTPPTEEVLKQQQQGYTLDSEEEEGNVSSMGREENTEDSKLEEILNATVPFYVQVLLLMLIPISFLVAFSSIAVDNANQSYKYITNHVEIGTETIRLGDLLMEERHYNSLTYAYYEAGNTTALEENTAILAKLRPEVDETVEHLKHLCTDSSDEHFREDHMHHLNEAMLEWAALRTKADHFLLTTMMNEQMLEILADVADAINVLTNNQKAALSTHELRALFIGRQLCNFVGAARTGGVFALSLGRPMTTKETILYNRIVARLYEYQFMFWHIMEHESQTWLDWLNSVPVVNANAFAQIDEISTGNYTVYGNISSAEHDQNMLNLLSMITTKQYQLLSAASSGEREQEVIVKWTLLLVAAILASLAAAAFLVYKEAAATATMKRSLEYSQKLTKAVQRYVPRRLLKLMGSTSIMQVTVGDYAEVAVTMLFSDIRDFSALSEVMTNPDLFNWLQDYLSETTRITESRGGFVDKFIGDAVFTVFHSPHNAILCGVDMHVAADTINLSNIGRNREHLLKIGVGIHHGVVCAGLLGDDSRLNATLVSSDVNHASRLEGLTKTFGARILVSSAVANQVNLNSFASRRIGNVTTKGHSNSDEVFEVFQADQLQLKEFKQKTKKRFEEVIRGVETSKNVAKGKDELRQLMKLMEKDGTEDSVVCHFFNHMDENGHLCMLVK